MEKTKTFGILPCSPPMTVTLSLPHRGYVPRQLIPITVNINNQTGTKINCIKLQLEMVSLYVYLFKMLKIHVYVGLNNRKFILTKIRCAQFIHI